LIVERSWINAVLARSQRLGPRAKAVRTG
jgi:hypothetical protein